MNSTINPESCPFCNNVNNCMVNDKLPCWCNNAAIPAEMISILPDKLQNKNCICSACINMFNENPEKFKNEYSLNHCDHENTANKH